MGPIWATSIWANPYGTHAEPGCTPHMGSPYGTHIGMFAGGLIKRKFIYMDKDLFLTLYKSLVRFHLDYENLVFYPNTKKYKQNLENAPRRATRLVPELRGLTYKGRLI